MRKFLITMLAVVFMMAGVSMTAEAQTDASYKFTVVTSAGTKTETATLSSLLSKYAASTEEVTIVAPYGVTDLTLTTSATVGEKVTLVLPCTAGQTSTETTAVNPDVSESTNQTNVSKLKIDGSSKLTVKGAVIVSGQTGKGGEIHNVVTGNYGQIQVAKGSSIVVANGGEFHNYGYVTGLGTMTAQKGAEVKDLYQIARFIGGGELLRLFGIQTSDTTAALVEYRKNGIAEDEYSFPLPEAGTGNIAISTKYADGSVLIGTAKIYAASGENACEAMIIGDDGLYVQNGGYIWKKSTLSADRCSTLNKETYSFYGKCKLGSTNVAINLMNIFSMDLTSEKFVYAISGNTTLRVRNGATLEVAHAFKFLPGSTLEVQEGGTLKLNEAPVNGKFGATGLKAVVTGTNSTGYLVFAETVRGPYGSGTTPAQLKVAGTVDLGTNGYIFGLSANTLKMESTGKITIGCKHAKAISEWTIPEAYNEEGVITPGEKITVSANWDYLKSVLTTSHTYGTWKANAAGTKHSATCTACKKVVSSAVTYTTNKNGTHTVDCGNESCTIAAKKVNCTWGTITTTKKATCTTAGVGKSTCKVCKASYAKIAIKATGHKYGAWTTTKRATLTASGTETKTCTNTSCTAKKTRTIDKIKSVTLKKTKLTYTGKTLTPSIVVKDSEGNVLEKGTDYTVSYLKNGKTATVKTTGKYTAKITFKGDYKGTKSLTFYVVPGATSKVSVEKTTTTLKATWKKVTGATGYRVQLLSSKGKVLDTVYKTGTVATFKGLSKGTTYKIKVTAYKTINDVRYYSLSSKTVTSATKPAVPTSVKATAGTKKATISWKKLTNCTGYEIRYSTDPNFKTYDTATVSSKSTVTKTIKNLKKGKKYYFKVRAYKTVNNVKVYGAFSSKVSVKIK